MTAAANLEIRYKVRDRCRVEKPEWPMIDNHFVACHFADELRL